jgi:hypothetical protein
MPVQKNVTFFPFSPIPTSSKDRTGRYFSEQNALIFPEYADYKPTKNIPPLMSYEPKLNSDIKIAHVVMKSIRLVYFLFLTDGSILTLCFGRVYKDDDKTLKWAKDKISELDKFSGNPEKLVNYFNNPQSEAISRGLNQDYSEPSVIFFYIYNREMQFYSDRFSFSPISPAPALGNPFEFFKSSDANFFGLYNSFRPNTSNAPVPVPSPYAYKFNLHMATRAYPGDYPQLIPFVIDPDIKNTGPP